MQEITYYDIEPKFKELVSSIEADIRYYMEKLKSLETLNNKIDEYIKDTIRRQQSVDLDKQVHYYKEEYKKIK